MDAVLTQAASLGVAGLLFVMWWQERQDRLRGEGRLARLLEQAGRIGAAHEQLLEVVRANTEALTALREELRSGRAMEQIWREQVLARIEGMTVEE